MAIRVKNIIGAAALVGATTLVTTEVVSRQQEGDMAAMMEKWMELAQPGPEHAQMAKLAGKWTQQQTHWMYPGAEPTVSTATAEFRPVLGGRYMMEHTSGTMEFMGEQHDFEGLGLFGFDNYTKKHTFVWADNMGTMFMLAEGEADPTGKIITYYSELPNPMTGETMTFKSVAKQIGDDKSVFEMYEKTPDGGWHKSLEITGTRN